METTSSGSNQARLWAYFPFLLLIAGLIVFFVVTAVVGSSLEGISLRTVIFLAIPVIAAFIAGGLFRCRFPVLGSVDR